MPNSVQAGGDTLADAGHDALRRADWDAARARFEASLAQGEDNPAVWEGLGWACHWTQQVDRLFDARQEAYRRYQDRGDRRSAARIATLLAADFLEVRGEAAVARGWLERARQLLDRLDPSVEHAFLKEIEAHFALTLDRDPVAAGTAAREALGIARAVGDLDHEMLAQALEGMALVTSGAVPEGMRRLDASAAAALGGDMADFNTISITCCYVIQACERVRDVTRAGEWCARFEELCRRRRLGSFLTFCRLQYGTVLLWRGDWEQAEAELGQAGRDLAVSKPSARAGALVRLAELRRRQGRWEEAAGLLEQARDHPLALLRQAALALDRNDFALAEELADQAGRRRAGARDADAVSALELLTRARAARGAIDPAAESLAELEARAEELGTPAVRAAARIAAGVLARARGDQEQARAALEDAVDWYEAANAPFEAAVARLELARALRAGERPGPAQAVARAALVAFDRLGASHSILLARRFLDASPDDRAPGPRTARLTPRQAAILRLVAQGLSNREIGARLELSEYTVHRHLANIYTRLGVSGRAAAVARALQEGMLEPGP